MRTRSRHVVALAAVLLFSLTACGGADSKDEPSAPMTEYTVPCAEFEDTAKKITDAQTEMYDGSGNTEAIETLLDELEALKADAPADVEKALTELADAFRSAAEIMKSATPGSTVDFDQLAKLAPELSEDSQKVTAYIVSKCK